MHEIEENVKTVYVPNAGFIKVGFTHALRHVLFGTTFEEAIRYLPSTMQI